MSSSDDNSVAAYLPIIGGTVVGVGLLALIYKMFFTKKPEPEPVCRWIRRRHILPEKRKHDWPCSDYVIPDPCDLSGTVVGVGLLALFYKMFLAKKPEPPGRRWIRCCHILPEKRRHDWPCPKSYDPDPCGLRI